ncbi:3-hydroxyacyl-CoA dehydrogenase NAD-binding domain-containing protein [Candidatus Uabimicrobium amorphum]|uniref:3-hydroxyacyl-CoA dehydrogenase n=1 Tax=Uabimicrobium amorphum TaxID=2596890 RepID=A0A5S9IM07_UABAM|nr:3-hydroxyacyl-CoA dehydrogenase NAD-binding domain-containing protein [Candidatus Uabimicrobium amorphum]BBM83035.1 3-hydroxyacyl-CoA dehydrogenase [Candidatus Uabimicrobium amorphum]
MAEKIQIGVLGSGTMGNGIAQIAATQGHDVIIVDNNEEALVNASKKLQKIFTRLVEKKRMTTEEMQASISRTTYTTDFESLSNSKLIIEAIVEDLNVKQQVFEKLENIVSEDCILATNTSSLSVTAVASGCKKDSRVLGIHFFNPAPLMPLVEIVPGLATDEQTLQNAKQIIDSWGKTVVIAKDTPGFIVNRIARPFYGESIRILEEGVADVATIDWALKEYGFRMGPFELMDLIGNDVNYKVTCSVFAAFFYDQRYKPSFTQQRLVEARRYGRKSGHGYYSYAENAQKPEAKQDKELAEQIMMRVVCMIINEAVDAVFLQIASAADIDLAMTKGVNYPKGPIAWAQEMGLEKVLDYLQNLYEEYGEDRYRPSPLLRRMVKNNQNFD